MEYQWCELLLKDSDLALTSLRCRRALHFRDANSVLFEEDMRHCDMFNCPIKFQSFLERNGTFVVMLYEQDDAIIVACKGFVNPD